MKTILVFLPLNDSQKLILRKAAPDYQIIFKEHDKKNISPDEISQAEIIIGTTSPKLISKAVNLKWLQLYSAGADQFIKPGILPPNAFLTNATGAYGLAVGEHMTAMLLQLIKNLHLYRDNQRVNNWHDEGQVRSIRSCTVLVVGLGDIGKEFSKLIKGFGARVIATKRRPDDKPDYVDELHLSDKLDDLLPMADVVALALPNTPDTTNLFNRQRINQMKPGSILLNVGRGTVLDQDALCDALDRGHLAGAGVDVTFPEPLPVEHRMWQTKNLIITPHVSGNFHIPEIAEIVFEIAMENLKRFQKCEPLLNIVDFTTGYKK